ncbi:MAG TPA: plastocyanin/azurin family copper-binding protein [Ktedonobacteraceae bacterium]|nr:plastocyanin/azurin family copper-binding protein [Ktedonobacteraceae bacterium]
MTMVMQRLKLALSGMGVFLLVLTLAMSFVASSASQVFAAGTGFSQQAHAATAAVPDAKHKKTVKIITQNGTFTFSPKTLKITVGTTVTWKNTTTVSHTSTSDTGVWDSGIIPPGGKFSFKFTTKGTFTYHCNIHPFMMATIIVS